MNSKGKFGAALLYILTRPLAALPLGFHRAFGRFAGWVCRSLLHYRTDVVMINLAKSFPEKKYGELRDISKRFYRYFGTVFSEAIWFGGCTRAERLRRSGIVRIANVEVVNELYAKGKSVFVMGSHCGNWELFGGIKQCTLGEGMTPLAFPENDVCVVYRGLSNKAWDRFMYRNRMAPVEDKEHYDGEVESFSVIRYAFTHRHEAKLYVFITDQYPYSQKSVLKLSKPFLNQPTSTMEGVSSLARTFGMAVVYLGMKVDGDGNYVWSFTPVCEDAAGWTDEALMERYYELLEADVREQPWNYLWTHKRWK